MPEELVQANDWDARVPELSDSVRVTDPVEAIGKSVPDMSMYSVDKSTLWVVAVRDERIAISEMLLVPFKAHLWVAQ
jgi:hypothetical protein